MTVLFIEEDEGITALALPFDIAGFGETRTDAVHDVLLLVEDYLACGFADGKTFEQLRRPSPKRYWWRVFKHSVSSTARRGRPPRQRATETVEEIPLPQPALAC